MDLVLKNTTMKKILALAYIGLSDTNFTPFLKPLAENANSISLLFKMENDLVTADILRQREKHFLKNSYLLKNSISYTE